MPEENRGQDESDVTETRDSVSGFDARADKIARKYALSFQLTIVITLGVMFFLTVFGELPLAGVFYALLPFLLLVYLFNVWCTKTLNPLKFYEGYYQRELDRARTRFPSEDGRASDADAEKESQKVFIVHGHDELSLERVARFVLELELKPVILKEQAGGANAIIQKLKTYSDVDYAIVLMTPDDFGGIAKNPSDIKPRARQNVMLELGYMLEKLGQNKMCILSKGGVEIPSDFSGVMTIDLDAGAGWKIELAKALKFGGLEVDFDKAL
jgi:hypothetical protein